MAHREQDNRVTTTGTYWWKTTGVTKTATVKSGEQVVCDDVDPGFWTDNDLTIVRSRQNIPLLSGAEVTSGGVKLREFFSYPIGYRPIPPPVTYYGGIPTFWDLQNLCVQIAARTSPSRANLSVPTAIGELRDIPQLIQNAGNRALRAVASGYLSWRFCLAPMISDLRKMARFTKAVQSRFERLTRMASRPWSTSTVSLARSTSPIIDASTDSQGYPKRVTIHSEGATVTAYRKIRYTHDEWCSIRWKLLVQPPLDAKSRFDLSERLVRGITCYEALQTAWNLQPWSWLVDWFLDIGTWLQANNNTIPAIASGFCWMCTDTSETWYTQVNKPSWLELTGQHGEGIVRKLRRCPGVSPLLPPIPVMPALTAGTISILGSLALLKMNLPKRFR